MKFGVIAKLWLQSSCFKFPFILKPKHKSLGGVVRGRPKDVAWCGPGLHKLLLLLPPPMKSFLLTSHSPWAHMTHTHRHTQTDNRARQNQDMTSYTGREAKWLFSLFFCIFFYSILYSLLSFGGIRPADEWERERILTRLFGFELFPLGKSRRQRNSFQVYHNIPSV